MRLRTCLKIGRGLLVVSACALQAAILLGIFAGTTGCARSKRADFVVVNGAEPATIDPQRCLGQPDGRVAAELFEGLMRRDPRTAQPVPGLADRWEVSSNQTVYTFHLRTNAFWSNGEPITADNVVWSWQRLVNPGTAAPYASLLFYVRGGRALHLGQKQDMSELGIHAMDSRTVRVELEEPTPFFLELCAFRALVVVPPQFIERHGENWIRAKPLLCSGPFTLESWQLNDRIRLRKNPRYWDAANVELDSIDILPTEPPNSAVNLYLTGAADYIADSRSIPTDLMDVLRSRSDFHSFEYLATYFLRFNVTREPFNDPRVRRAIVLGVDRQRISRRLLRQEERPAATLTPPNCGGYTPPEGLGFDIALARRLLADAGYPEGRGMRPVRYMFNAGGGGGSRLHEQIGIEMQQMLGDNLGIRLELQPVEWKTFLSDQRQLNYDISRGSWVADFQFPNTFLDLFQSGNGNNRTGWTNAEYDALLKQASLERDMEKRFARLQLAERLLVNDEAPIWPIFYYAGFFALDPEKWTGIYPNPIDTHPLRAVRRSGQ